MTAAAHFHPSHHEQGRATPQSFLFGQWALADQHVPYPFLFFWLARPPAGQPAAKLHHLSHIDFIYSITGDFIAHLTSKGGVSSRAVIHREAFGYRFLPIQGQRGLITPEAAERAIESYPLLRQLEFWEQFYYETGLGAEKVIELELDYLFERYRQLPWHSLRLERPLRAGVLEPIYRFRKADSRCEFVVGATTGTVRHEFVADPAPPAPGNSPLPS